jgi:7,8-dihydro-6-hydroxymethylpterin-pyrophosphokinase
VISSPQLKLPHPALHQRRFVLEPLAPDVRHRIFKRTQRELWQALPHHGGKLGHWHRINRD